MKAIHDGHGSGFGQGQSQLTFGRLCQTDAAIASYRLFARLEREGFVAGPIAGFR